MRQVAYRISRTRGIALRPVRKLDSHSITVRRVSHMLAFAVAGFVLAVVGSLAPMLWAQRISSRKYDVVTPPRWFIVPAGGINPIVPSGLASKPDAKDQ